MNPIYTVDTVADAPESVRSSLTHQLSRLQSYANSIGTQLGVRCIVQGRESGDRLQYRMTISGAMPFDAVWRTEGALEDRLSYVRATLASARSIQKQGK